jgi:hypothetical protein
MENSGYLSLKTVPVTYLRMRLYHLAPGTLPVSKITLSTCKQADGFAVVKNGANKLTESTQKNGRLSCKRDASDTL